MANIVNEWNDWGDSSSFGASVSSKVVPRWQRKALERAGDESGAAASASTSTLLETPSKRARTPKKRSTPQGDRFIPNRSAMDLGASYGVKENASDAQEELVPPSPAKEEYNQALEDTLLSGRRGAKVLAFKSKAPAPEEGYQNSMRVLYSQNKAAGAGARKVTRHIPQAPERVLDAPDLLDDYYLNLLDWSKTNVLAVALGATAYLWNAENGSIAELCTVSEPDNFITSLSWTEDGAYVAVGTNSSEVQLWDVEATRQVRALRGHHARVGALAWNKHVLSSGSRDALIFNHDVRVQAHHIATLEGHTQEVCGLKWSPNGEQLASGGNDNMLHIWDAAAAGPSVSPKFSLDAHQAAVKAIAWCPWQENLLATGGGTADRCIKFWNTQTGSCLNSVDTKSQVCSLLWSPHQRELVSSHGFSQNQLCIWRYPSMTKITELTGHTSRVLHLAMSPDGETVVSAAGDETLRFWKCFARDSGAKASKAAAGDERSILRNANIR